MAKGYYTSEFRLRFLAYILVNLVFLWTINIHKMSESLNVCAPWLFASSLRIRKRSQGISAQQEKKKKGL